MVLYFRIRPDQLGLETSEECCATRGGIMTGTIRTLRVGKGSGFIKDAGGKDYFFHQSRVLGAERIVASP